jgi:hypothetical protein
MSDPAAPGASALFGDTPAAPDPSLPLGTPDLPQISRTRSDAHGEIARLKGDAAFQQLLLKGDPHALAKVQTLQRIINSPTQTVVGGEPNPQEIEQRLSAWTEFADLSPEVIQQVRSGGMVSKAEYDNAVRTKARFMADREWAKRYLDGGRRERAQMSLVSIILSSPIAPEAK